MLRYAIQKSHRLCNGQDTLWIIDFSTRIRANLKSQICIRWHIVPFGSISLSWRGPDTAALGWRLSTSYDCTDDGLKVHIQPLSHSKASTQRRHSLTKKNQMQINNDIKEITIEKKQKQLLLFSLHPKTKSLHLIALHRSGYSVLPPLVYSLFFFPLLFLKGLISSSPTHDPAF